LCTFLTGQVVDALVEHFVAFADDERRMPVVWHQSLLCFVQRYKHEIKEGDKPRLRALCSEQHHYQVRRLPSRAGDGWCW
jgi:essential nuclear protein 1